MEVETKHTENEVSYYLLCRLSSRTPAAQPRLATVSLVQFRVKPTKLLISSSVKGTNQLIRKFAELN